MPGLSAASRRVRFVNANWTGGTDGDDAGSFEFLIVTEDDERHTVAVSCASAAALVAMMQEPEVVMIWDPEARGLTIANLHGRWLAADLTLLPGT